MSAEHELHLDTLCRTCMKCTTVLEPLFPSPEEIPLFVHTLYFSTGLKIQSNDGLPQKICKDCSKSIKDATHFRKQCRETEIKLLKYFSHTSNREELQKCDYCQQPGISQFKADSEDNLSDMKCESDEMCGKIMVESPKILSEDETFCDKTVSVVGVTTNIPSSDVATKTVVEQTQSYDRKRYLELIEGPVLPKQPIRCKICKKYSKCLNSFEKHAMSHLGYNILCEFCAKSCISKANLLRHQRRKHGVARDDSFPCPVCKFQAIDKEQLEVHERKVHTKERPFVCSDCGAAFFSKRVLVQHQANHKTDQPFQCDICTLKFKLRCRLTKHIHRVHTKNYLKYTYGCYVCLKKYSRTHHVRRHLMKIHGIPTKQQEKIQRFEIRNSFNAPFTMSPNVSPQTDHA